MALDVAPLKCHPHSGYSGIMIEQEGAATAVDPALEVEIEFLGRKIFVRMPKQEQLLVWRRTLKQLQGAEGASWNGTQVMNTLERLRSIIDSMIVNRVDIEWLDEEMLAGRLGLEQAVTIVPMAAEEISRREAESGNREERRAAKKMVQAKKAARKQATK